MSDVDRMGMQEVKALLEGEGFRVRVDSIPTGAVPIFNSADYVEVIVFCKQLGGITHPEVGTIEMGDLAGMFVVPMDYDGDITGVVVQEFIQSLRGRKVEVLMPYRDWGEKSPFGLAAGFEG